MSNPHENTTPPSAAAQASSTPQVAVWYFIAATFVFAAPVTLFPDLEFWVRLVVLGFGFLLMVVGGIQLRKELTARKDACRQQAEPPTHTER